MCTEKCCVCGNILRDCKIIPINRLEFFESTCDICGKYNIDLSDTELDANARNVIAPYLFYSNEMIKSALGNMIKKQVFITTEKKYKMVEINVAKNSKIVTLEKINRWYPQTNEDKIYKILIGLSNRPEYNSGCIKLNTEQLYSAFFVKRYDIENKYSSQKLTAEKLEGQIDTTYQLLRKYNYIALWKNSSVERMNIILHDISLTEEGKEVDFIKKNGGTIIDTKEIKMNQQSININGNNNNVVLGSPNASVSSIGSLNFPSTITEEQFKHVLEMLKAYLNSEQALGRDIQTLRTEIDNAHSMGNERYWDKLRRFLSGTANIASISSAIYTFLAG